MNKKREPYDRIAVGERIRHKRIQLGLSQDELAVRINRATKYCSDIERGMCGMSVETMLAIAKSLDMNLDYMMFGEISETEREWQQKDAMTLIHIIEKAPASQRNYAIRLLKLFIAATGNSPTETRSFSRLPVHNISSFVYKLTTTIVPNSGVKVHKRGRIFP